MNDKDNFGFFNGLGNNKSFKQQLKDRMKTTILKAKTNIGRDNFIKTLAADYIEILEGLENE